LYKGFAAAEKSFLELAESNANGGVNRSGSCALAVLIVGNHYLLKFILKLF